MRQRSTGLLALAGGGEFRPDCSEMDRALLAALGLPRPRVIILPTAAALEGPERAAANGVDYFTALGADVRSVMILSRTDASDPEVLASLQDADLYYFAGGSPRHLLETMRDTPAWAFIRRHYEEGVALAGSSAGAMVMGEKMLSGMSGGWQEALGLVPRLGLIPHLERLAPDRLENLRSSLGAESNLLGVDSATACVKVDGEWRVWGKGRASLYAGGEARFFAHGDAFRL